MHTSKNHKTLTFSGKDYAVDPRDECESLCYAVEKDATDFEIAHRVLDDADEELVTF